MLTQKKVGLARCRLVVREFGLGADSPLESEIYAPTSFLDSFRTLLALTHLRKLHLKTLVPGNHAILIGCKYIHFPQFG